MVEEYFRIPDKSPRLEHDPREIAKARRDRALPAGFADAREMGLRSWRAADFWFVISPPELHRGRPIDVGLSFTGHLDDRGVMIIAGNGGGKGVSLIIPNLVTWPGGVFCIDVKGELASHTATRRGTREAAQGTGTTVRHFLGQDVAVLDPFHEVKGPAATKAYTRAYNPLAELNPSSPAFVAEVRRIAAALTVDEKGEGRFFTDMAKILIAGVIEVVVKCAPPHTLLIALVAMGRLPAPRGFEGRGRREEPRPVQGGGFDPGLYGRGHDAGGGRRLPPDDGPYGGHGGAQERIGHDQPRIPHDPAPQGYSSEDAKRFFAMSGLDGPGSNTAKATELARRLQIALGPDDGAAFLHAAARDGRLPKNIRTFYIHAEALIVQGRP